MATKTKQKGTINVQSENIFPIIKKFLYSDQEIFLRELVSNAVDASQKLKALSSMGEFKGELGELLVEVILDEKKKTITIRDNGIGMTQDEVDKYINQIAFSGAEEFVQKYKDKTEGTNIIGHFGLGFYSSFMVADQVDIITKSYKEDSEAVKWTCDGSPEFTLTTTKKETRGTDIVLHISDDAKEFLQEYKIRELLNKYCKFLPVKIKFGTKEQTEKDEKGKEKKVKVDNIINNPEPAWTKKPADLKDEDYKEFYKELYPYTFDDPLFHVHLNVDYPFHLTGVLYFPKIKEQVEVQKNKIQLYSNQVFVTDAVEGIVPEFLTLLHGVIDSPDIPLNVSRSYLQSDGNVKKIAGHISKKVADKLEELFKKDRKDFESKWDDIKIFIEYGMISDEKFFDRAKKFLLLKNTDGEYYSLEEYEAKIKDNQTDKDKKLVYLYTNDVEVQHAYIEGAKAKGYDVLVLNTPLSGHFIGQLEQKLDNVTFARVDSDTIEKLIDKDEKKESKISAEEQDKLKPIIEEVVPKEKFNVVFESLDEQASPFTIVKPEFSRRMQDMSAIGGGGMFGGKMPEIYNLIVNANHPLVSKILKTDKKDKQKELARKATDLAMLSQNMLKGKDLTEFVKRNIESLAN